ncbi:MAG: taurine dioxygenase [Acidimicrobiales bacterium]|nr:MAG: taurine dioxygenase [Acidimicrobiales bacterium]
MTDATALDITPTAGALGAIVRGLDLHADVSDADIAAIQRALLDYKVIFLPDQHLDRDQHVALGRRFGDLESFHPSDEDIDDPDKTHPEVLSLRSEQGLIADLWHTDVTWSETPPVASLVRMELTPDHGGDTIWSNQAAAFAALSAPMREMLLGLTAVHTGRPLGHPNLRATHPVVRAHPETGEACLYVNRQFTKYIAELSPGEGDALLTYLFNWCEQPQFTYRHQWSKGTVAMWDNRCTMHYVVNDFVGPRILERVTITGDDPQPAGDVRWPAYKVTGVSASAGPTLMR